MHSYLASFQRRALRAAAVVLAVVGALVLSPQQPANAERPNLTVQWLPVGPSGSQIGSGKVNAFEYVHSNPNVMYFGGGWGNTPRESPSQTGVYRTTNGGSTWTPINNGLTNTDGTISSVINGLWLDQSNPQIVLAATEFGGTFRSTDGGNTWSNVDRSESSQFSQAGSSLYVATSRGVLVSTNNGATWSVSLSRSTGASTVVTAGGATYAGTMSGDVLRFNGTMWASAGHPGTGPVHDLAVDPFNASIVYANVDDQSAWNQDLYGSVDGGTTWKQIFCSCSVGAQAIAFSLVVPHRLYLGDDGGGFVYYFTADGNQNPTLRFGTQPFGVDLRYIIPARASTNTDDACYLLMDQGLFLAPHCTSGTAPPLNANVPDTLAYDVKVTSNAKHAIVALQDNSAAESLDRGATWSYPNTAAQAGEGGESFIDPANPQHCYFAHPDQGLWVSTDACATFSGPVLSGAESLTFDPAHAGKVYAIRNADNNLAQIVVSTDGGTSWSAAPWHFSNPYQVAISPTTANTIVVATGTATGAPKLSYSHDGGTTWHQATGLPQLAAPNATIYFAVHRFFVAFEARSSGTVLLADHDPTTDNVLVYRSTNNAQSFSLVKTFVQPIPPRSWPHLLFPTSDERSMPRVPYYATRFFGNRLAFNPQAPTGTTPAVILTTRFGAYVSFDDGSHWQRIDKQAIAHHFIGAAWNNGFVFLASFGQGVIRTAARLQ